MTKAVLFDMDGVLVYSVRAHYEAWREVFAAYGLEFDFEAFTRTLGTDSNGTMDRLFGSRFGAEERNRLADRKEAAFRDAIRRQFVPVDGAEALLAALHRNGWPMALATSAPPENVECVMSLLKGGELVSVRVDVSMVARAKPAPDIFLAAAERLGMNPRDCIVIEDSVAGLNAARSVGMATLGLATSLSGEAMAPHADRVMDSLAGVTPEVLLGVFAARRI